MQETTQDPNISQIPDHSDEWPSSLTLPYQTEVYQGYFIGLYSNCKPEEIEVRSKSRSLFWHYFVLTADENPIASGFGYESKQKALESARAKVIAFEQAALLEP